ncbi:hypothetical protein [Mycolicibacterium holsaticum]|uniref:hypothetical protein n=1 Tax=Mycolicibacterium holsaticum TaxID=152142 RepID=UPI001C7D5F09|nr:hypothetical protein [Mycolicibacterium holsaticum]MDA4108158.1 hypothetical protein [Mycolicibacterium holsaticum DSM 44478 = JCM 12374]QZA14432.1 hypothetical protein K3U96_10180 [Mycolicibacterium holsaticum DSM 44478 = JCM 12374]UNC08118.1 hypothetical protein H5U41_16650 [Mycolicibacterium holsaticum DSM 44478 = JCM 12374]
MAPREGRQDSYRRAARAYRLRVIGRTWQEIADAEGYKTRSGAQLAVRRHLAREAPESIEDQRRAAVDGIRVAQAVLFERLALAVERDDDDRIASISKEIRAHIAETSRLNGLAAPVRSEVDVRMSHSTAAILDRAERELLALSAQRQREFPVIDAEVMEAVTE